MRQDSKHHYTIEILYHFNCGCCENWWSYPYTPNQLHNYELELVEQKVWCPHCGHTQEIKVKDGFILRD